MSKRNNKKPKPYVNPIDHGTPETRKKLHKESPWRRIVKNHRVPVELQAAADEVRDVFLSVSRVVMFCRPTLEVVDHSRTPDPFAGMNDRTFIAWKKRYMPWANEMSRLHKGGDKPFLGVAISILADEMSPSRIEDANGWHRKTAVNIVLEALERYARMAGWRIAA